MVCGVASAFIRKNDVIASRWVGSVSFPIIAGKHTIGPFIAILFVGGVDIGKHHKLPEDSGTRYTILEIMGVKGRPLLSMCCSSIKPKLISPPISGTVGLTLMDMRYGDWDRP